DLDPSEGVGKGKAGWVNVSESLDRLVKVSPGWMEVVPGCRVGRCEAAGGDRRHLAGRENTATPGSMATPAPAGSCACGTWEPRVGPDITGRPTVRKVELPHGN